jgi:hypothetical protein
LRAVSSLLSDCKSLFDIFRLLFADWKSSLTACCGRTPVELDVRTRPRRRAIHMGSTFGSQPTLPDVANACGARGILSRTLHGRRSKHRPLGRNLKQCAEIEDSPLLETLFPELYSPLHRVNAFPRFLCFSANSVKAIAIGIFRTLARASFPCVHASGRMRSVIVSACPRALGPNFSGPASPAKLGRLLDGAAPLASTRRGRRPALSVSEGTG